MMLSEIFAAAVIFVGLIIPDADDLVMVRNLLIILTGGVWKMSVFMDVSDQCRAPLYRNLIISMIVYAESVDKTGDIGVFAAVITSPST